jgi:hypothetical protein
MNCHSRALPVILSTLVLSHASLAAPKPVGGGYIDTRARDQEMRFQAVGLTIPPVPPNGGLCVIETGGHVAPPVGQTGEFGRYRLYEIQTWTVAPSPAQVGQVPLSYNVAWNSIGNGFRHEDNGVGTVDDWKFAISAHSDTTLSARKDLMGSWLVQMAPASMLNGVSVTQQQTVSGRSNAPGTSMSPDYAVGFPGMTVAPKPGSQPNAPVAGSQRASWQVPQQIRWGYPMPGYATGSINCTWNVSVGP